MLCTHTHAHPPLPFLSRQACTSDSDCNSSHRCRDPSAFSLTATCAPDSAACVCVPEDVNIPRCDTDKDCDSKSCLFGFCVPKVEVSEDGEVKLSNIGLCIGVNALAHLPQQELVFDAHPTAPVLCDLNGSCATPGHVVVWNGSAMMMKSYCRDVGCVRNIMQVNSPTFRRARRIDSQTKGLLFTALAAKYETMVEEHLLRTVVRAGL